MKLFNYQLASLNQLTKTHFQIQILPLIDVMPYQAGQYLNILYPNNTFMPFSIANPPAKNHYIELHIRVSATDKDTQNFIDALQTTKQVTISGPYGDCQFEEGRGRLLIIAAGTGFAPAKAIIEKIIEQESNEECHLYWTVKRSSDFYLPELPLQWQKKLPNFSFIPICTEKQEQKYRKPENLFDLILKNMGGLDTTLVYVFGPRNLAVDILNKLIPMGLDKKNFYTDVLL